MVDCTFPCGFFGWRFHFQRSALIPEVLDYALASSFQKLREGERQVIEEISGSLGPFLF